MLRSKHTEAQVIAAVMQMEAGRKAEDVAREVGVSTHTIYASNAKFDGMDVSEAQEAKRRRIRRHLAHYLARKPNSRAAARWLIPSRAEQTRRRTTGSS